MPYRPKIKNADGSLTDLPLEAETTVKLKTSRSIGLSGVTATAQSFNGTSAITIPITAVPVSLLTGLLDKTYPVGSIYMSTSSTSPASLFGGTWTTWGAGRVPISVNTSDSDFSSADKTGGEKKHTLTTSEIPSHSHSVSLSTTSGGSHSHDIKAGVFKVENDMNSSDDYVVVDYSTYSGSNWVQNTITRVWNCVSAGSHSHSVSGSTGSSGSSSSHNNLQPYITCYMWKRTA